MVWIFNEAINQYQTSWLIFIRFVSKQVLKNFALEIVNILQFLVFSDHEGLSVQENVLFGNILKSVSTCNIWTEIFSSQLLRFQRAALLFEPLIIAYLFEVAANSSSIRPIVMVIDVGGGVWLCFGGVDGRRNMLSASDTEETPTPLFAVVSAGSGGGPSAAVAAAPTTTMGSKEFDTPPPPRRPIFTAAKQKVSPFVPTPAWKGPSMRRQAAVYQQGRPPMRPLFCALDSYIFLFCQRKRTSYRWGTDLSRRVSAKLSVLFHVFFLAFTGCGWRSHTRLYWFLLVIQLFVNLKYLWIFFFQSFFRVISSFYPSRVVPFIVFFLGFIYCKTVLHVWCTFCFSAFSSGGFRLIDFVSCWLVNGLTGCESKPSTRIALHWFSRARWFGKNTRLASTHQLRIHSILKYLVSDMKLIFTGSYHVSSGFTGSY